MRRWLARCARCARRVSASYRRPMLAVAIKHPEARRPEQESGEDGDGDEEYPGHRRGVAHIELLEGALVEIDRVEERRVNGTTAAVRDHEGLGEALERADGQKDGIEEED